MHCRLLGGLIVIRLECLCVCMQHVLQVPVSWHVPCAVVPGEFQKNEKTGRGSSSLPLGPCTSILLAAMEQQADADEKGEDDDCDVQPLVPDEDSDCDGPGDVGDDSVGGAVMIAASVAGRMRSDRDFCDPEYCPSDSDDDADQRFDMFWSTGTDPESLFGGFDSLADSVFDDPVVPTPTVAATVTTTTTQTIANDGRGFRCVFVCVLVG